MAIELDRLRSEAIVIPYDELFRHIGVGWQ